MTVDGIWCGALQYADVVLIAETGGELQMLDRVGRWVDRLQKARNNKLGWEGDY